MNLSLFISRLCLCLALLLGQKVMACSTPVFRYALERWAPSFYEVLVFHREPLSTNDQAVVNALREASHEGKGYGNYGVSQVDVSGKMREAVQKLWQLQTNAALPWIVVRYPLPDPEMPNAWAGPLTAQNVLNLADSPIRREIASQLGKGDSIAWLFVESSDRTVDEREFARVEGLVKKVVSEVEFPADPSGFDTNMVKMSLKHPVLRVPVQNPGEGTFRQMLLNPDPELTAKREPVLVPVFGRGRALAAIPIAQFNAEVAQAATTYLLGACSCEIKEQNPGFDLLIAANWDALLGGERMSDGPPPELVSLASLVEKPARQMTKAAPATNQVSVVVASVEPVNSLARNLAWAGLVGLVLVGGASLLLLRKRG